MWGAYKRERGGYVEVNKRLDGVKKSRRRDGEEKKEEEKEGSKDSRLVGDTLLTKYYV